MNLVRYVFSKSYRKHRWLRQHLSRLRPLYKAMWPFFRAIKFIELPPRYPAGDQRNIKRVSAISKALLRLRDSGHGS